MHLPRQQISQLYTHLVKTTASSSAQVLILSALTVDSICATRILHELLRHDHIQHKITPVSGYVALQQAGKDQVLPMTRQRGGNGGTVICLGLGGTVAMEEILGLDGAASEDDTDGMERTAMENHGVEVWVIDARRPWNLENVFGSLSVAGQDGLGVRAGTQGGRVTPSYRPGKGGVIVWDDGDLDAELQREKEAYFSLLRMPDITENDLNTAVADEDLDEEEQDDDENPAVVRKRKHDEYSDDLDMETSSQDSDRPERRRRSNSNDSISIPSSPGGNPLSAQFDGTSTPPTMPSSPPKVKAASARQLRRQLLTLRREHEAVLEKHYTRGDDIAEPVSSMLYSLASELGREDNEFLWLAIVGITSVSSSSPLGYKRKAAQIREVLQDEVRRLNPVPESELRRSQSAEATIPTTARSSSDKSIRLSPEPKFLLIRHWSLYDAMLHSPYLATRLHVWSDGGKKRLHKLLAKMGISLQEANKGYLHMDSDIKRTLQQRILKFAEQYNLPELVPGNSNGRTGMADWGFVRSWGFHGTLSAEDVAIIAGALLEVGGDSALFKNDNAPQNARRNQHPTNGGGYNARLQRTPLTPPHSSDDGYQDDQESHDDHVTRRFFHAYDALSPKTGPTLVLQNLAAAQKLYRAISRVGAAILAKKQIRHLRSFRMAVVRDGPDVELFLHPGALVRLAAWIAEAVQVIEAEKGVSSRSRSAADAWVLASLDEERSRYIVVGLGGAGGWNGNGEKKILSKAERAAKEERARQRVARKASQAEEKARKKEEQRRLRRERNAANGDLDDDEDDDTEEEDASEADTDSSADSDSDGASDSENEGGRRKQSKTKGPLKNRFGLAFQETAAETGARSRHDSFEHSVVEVRKEDFARFLEALSMKAVVG